jgi:phenylalanyl-tRNA synthetase beta subunit
MEEQLLLLENPLLKVLLEDDRSDWVNPIFDEREKCCEFQSLFPMLLEQAQIFFSLEWGQTHSGTSYIILIS